VALSDEEIKLSKAVSGIGGLNMLQEAHERQIPVEGKVTETCKGGFHVEVLQRKAFCPISQMDIIYIEEGSEYVGQTLTFLILQFEERGRNIVVSRQALLARQQEKVRKQFYETLSLDSVMDGTVSRIMPYGVFVHLADGVEGMVHISEMNWSKTAAPESMAAVGDAVRVKVIGIELPEWSPLSFKTEAFEAGNGTGQRLHMAVSEDVSLGSLNTKVTLKLDIDGGEIVNACMQRGFLVNCVQGKILRFAPPLITDRQSIDTLIDCLDEALGQRIDPPAK